jgi:hypothetical protein
MLIPSRGRPESVARLSQAWLDTNLPYVGEPIWVVDRDDPRLPEYQEALEQQPGWLGSVLVMDSWQPMVPKLNWAARRVALGSDVVGFMGDDHLPRSVGWASGLAAAHESTGPGIYYGRDGIQDIRLPTWWAMSSEIVRTIGGLVPAPVEHLYCDNSVLELGKAARCIWYLPEILIEHMHPVAHKAEWDDGYRKVNDPDQYERDRRTFVAWLEEGRPAQAQALRQLRG